LPEDWQRKIEELAGNADEREAILREQALVKERLRRLTMLYKDLLIEDDEYRKTRSQLQEKLALLTVPEDQELIEAGQYLESLAPLWSAASLQERKEITRVMIESVYVDVKEGEILSIKPLRAFATILRDVNLDVDVDIIS